MTILALLLALLAQDPDAKPTPIEPIKPGQKGSTMDYGPFLSSTVGRVRYKKDADLYALKGLSIRVAKDVTACFDTDTLRWAAVWTGGFLDLAGTHLVTSKGSIPPTMGGTELFSTKPGPGVSKGEDWKDPRPAPYGPLPRGWGRYQGLFLNGERVILSYLAGEVPVLELPGWSAGIFTRTIRIGPSREPVLLLLAEGEGVWTGGNGLPEGARTETAAGRTVLRVPALAAPVVFTVTTGKGVAAVLSGPPFPDPAELCKGGPARWTGEIVAKGAVGANDAAYVLDTLPVPEENPWKAWMRLTALDFFSDGRAAVCTWSGDVWIVSGIDEKLEAVSWRRFATGLYEPLGLKVVGDTVYVLGRDQITRLHDLNGDGEADFYENFNNDATTMANYHAFAFELHTDPDGNFYWSSDGHRVDSSVPLHGCIVKVPKDGGPSEVFATGLRAANGMSVGPNGEVTCADNQGNWCPSSRLNWVRKGGFYGYVPHSGRAEAPKDFDPPLCWLPHAVDNSSGGQVWVTSGRWGPLKGRLLHTSYGTASLFHVPFEKVGDLAQGGVVKFPLAFASGVMRGRFNPKDGQLYLSGLRGWQTAGARDGCLQRVRYTGKPANMILDVRPRKGALELGFSDPLDPSEGADAGLYGAFCWNYLWSEKYGSDEYKLSDPKKKGRDALEVKSARLSEDRKTVTLEIPDLKPAMQVLVRVRVKAADGSPVSADLYHTIHRIP
jgi:hypothetical protein